MKVFKNVITLVLFSTVCTIMHAGHFKYEGSKYVFSSRVYEVPVLCDIYIDPEVLAVLGDVTMDIKKAGSKELLGSSVDNVRTVINVPYRSFVLGSINELHISSPGAWWEVSMSCLKNPGTIKLYLWLHDTGQSMTNVTPAIQLEGDIYDQSFMGIHPNRVELVRTPEKDEDDNYFKNFSFTLKFSQFTSSSTSLSATINTLGNLFSNGGFESWSAGPNSAPDNWATVDGIVERTEIGTYAAKLTGTTDCRLQYRIDNSLKNIAYWRSKTLTFGCWVYATKAGTTRLQIYDPRGRSSSSYHTGNSTWQWLTVTRTVDPAATSLYLFLNIEGDTSSNFSGPMCAESSSPSINLFPNRGFEGWSAGPSAAPDRWAMVGGTVEQVKIGTYAAKLTGTTGCRLQCRIDNSLKNIAYWRSKALTFGCWVYATKAGTTRLQIYDPRGRSSSSYHTGNSTWQWLTVTRTVDPAANSLYVFLNNEGDTSSDFTGAECTESI